MKDITSFEFLMHVESKLKEKLSERESSHQEYRTGRVINLISGVTTLSLGRDGSKEVEVFAKTQRVSSESDFIKTFDTSLYSSQTIKQVLSIISREEGMNTECLKVAQLMLDMLSEDKEELRETSNETEKALTES